MSCRALSLSIFLLVAGSAGSIQGAANPDISAIGEFRMYSHNDPARPDEKQKLSLADPELELAVTGHLNPHARADLYLAWHGEDMAEIEELYATFMRGLPLGVNLRVGKYLLEFGRLNPIHAHEWPFLKRPLPHERFFGDHGLADMAVRASFQLPAGGAKTEIMAGVFKGEALLGHHHDGTEPDEHEHETGEDRIDLGGFGRLIGSMTVSKNAELALGTSVINGVYRTVEPPHEGEEENQNYIPAGQLRAWVAGFDFKYEYKPTHHTSLTVEGEGLLRIEEQFQRNDLTSRGGYGCLDYRFRRKYNLGGIFEYVCRKELHEHEDAFEEHRSELWRAGLFLGLAAIEEAGLVRLAGHWTEPDTGDGFWDITFQFVFNLGPHHQHQH